MQHITCFHQQNKPKIIEIDQKMTELQLFKGVQILLGVCITMRVTKVQARVTTVYHYSTISMPSLIALLNISLSAVYYIVTILLSEYPK